MCIHHVHNLVVRSSQELDTNLGLVAARLKNCQGIDVKPFSLTHTARLSHIQSLVVPTAFGEGARVIAYLEKDEIGMTWVSLTGSDPGCKSAESVPDCWRASVVWSLCMLLVDAVIYGGLAWYIEGVRSGN